MGGLDVQACDAFNILAARSQHTNTKLATVARRARRCRGSGHTPDDAATLGDFLACRNIPHGQRQAALNERVVAGVLIRGQFRPAPADRSVR